MQTHTRGSTTTKFFDSEEEFENHQSQIADNNDTEEAISAMIAHEGPAEEDELDDDDCLCHTTNQAPQQQEVDAMFWVVNHNQSKLKTDGAGK